MNKIFTFLSLIATLCINAQDSCETAAVVTEGSYSVSSINGTPHNNSCVEGFGDTAANAEWYIYTATGNSYDVTVSASYSGAPDTRIQIFTGDCNNLTCVGGDDDGGIGLSSIANFFAVEGQSYYIVFDNRWTSDGFNFEVSEIISEAPPVTFTTETISLDNDYNECIVDMNGDFLDDIVSIGSTSVHINYQQATGGFSDAVISTPNASNLPSWSVAAGDIDGNGFNDLLYGSGNGVSFMFANSNGTGFTHYTSGDYVFSQRSNMVDINNDGQLDAFVCHDVDPNVYYTNDDGSLEFNQGGLGDVAEGGNYGSIWLDYDNDGDQDLFIAKCRGGASNAKYNEMHRNNGNGTFTNVSNSINMDHATQTWSTAWGDFDNDGDFDALIGANSFSDGGHVLMMNDGDGTFTDETDNSNLDEFQNGGREFFAFDFNNDGFIDVYSTMQGGSILLNNGDLTFTRIAANGGVASVGDLNNDGFLDYVAGETIYYNDGNDNNWIKINTIGTMSNINGIGARVEIHGDWGVQIRDVQSGIGFAHMHSLNTHFGIGESTSITKIVVNWPSGIVDEVMNPTPNTTVSITEGETLNTIDPIFVRENLKLSPIPADDYINVNSKLDLTDRVSIITSEGKLVSSKILNNRIYVGNLSTGVYLIKFETKDGKSVNRKVLIK